MTRPSRIVALAALGAAACGSTAAFSTSTDDNNVMKVQACVHKQGNLGPQGFVNSLGKPIALLATTPQPKKRLIAYDLAGKAKLWDVETEVSSRVVIGKDAVYYREGDSTLVARDLASGKQLWTQHLLGRLLGLAVDGDRVYYSAQKGDTQSSLIVALAAGSGTQAWSNDAEGLLGAPAARSGEVFVPYRSQYLTVLSGATGKEEARVRQKDEAITYVRTSNEGVFYGSKGVYFFDEKSCSGTKHDSTHVVASLPKDFGETSYYWNAYSTVSADYTALDRNRLLWQGHAGEGTIQFVNDVTVAQVFRFFFGFDAKTGHLSWAYMNPRVDVVGSDSNGKAVAFVSSEGDIGAIDASSGAEESLGKVDARLQGASFDIGAMAAPAGAKAADNGALAAELAKIVWDPDRRYNQVKVFAIDALATLSGAEVSEQLLNVVVHENVNEEILKKAGDQLVARKDAAALPALLKQLDVHFDYVTGERPRGVDVLARALGTLGAKEAGPALVAHLEDPQTPLATVSDVARALAEIGAAEAVPAFSRFVLTYRADPLFATDDAALASVVEGLLKLGGPREIELLEYVADDDRTQDKVREYVRKALDQRGEPQKPAETKAPAGKGKSGG